MSVLSAFSGVSPARLRALKNDPSEMIRRMTFESVFGSRPAVTDKPGGKVNLSLYTARHQYDAAMENFAELIPLPSGLGDREHARLIESTGGRVVGWLDKNGKEYIAIVGLPTGNAYRFPAWLFGNENIGDPVSIVWTSLIAHGAYLDLPPDVPGSNDAWDNIGPAIRAANERNKPPEVTG